jgi:protein-S-isoprenylcysteine O-methyltransferase Ste14
MGDEFVNAVRQPNQKSIRYIGITLVLIGLYFFVKQLNLPWLSWLNNNVLWAVMILLAGVALLVWGIRKGKGNG